MKVFFHYHSPDTPELNTEGGNLILYAYKPSIVHPGEIIKVATNISLKTEKGCFILFTSSSELIKKACQVFPATIIIDDKASDAPLEIPVMNCGRNPLNIMPKQALAIGKVLFDTPVEIEIYDAKSSAAYVKEKSTPQKRNVGVKFEVI